MSIHSSPSPIEDFYPIYTPHAADHAADDLYSDHVDSAGRNYEDLNPTFPEQRNEPSTLRKIARIAAKVTLAAIGALIAVKSFFAVGTAVLAAPMSLTLLIPGAFMWSIFVREEGENLVRFVNDKINKLI